MIPRKDHLLMFGTRGVTIEIQDDGTTECLEALVGHCRELTRGLDALHSTINEAAKNDLHHEDCVGSLVVAQLGNSFLIALLDKLKAHVDRGARR